MQRKAGSPPSSRREGQKTAVRASLIEAGLRLFVATGYDRVSVDDIAEAAGVSRRTFFNYFAGKEDIVFAWAEKARQALIDLVAHGDRALSPRELLRNCVLAVVDLLPVDEIRSLADLIHVTPALRGRQLLDMEGWETNVAEALVARLPRVSPIDARYLAMGAIGVLRIAGQRCIESGWKLNFRRTVDDGIRRLWPELAPLPPARRHRPASTPSLR
ncbi:TetR/AcrR family transcriptional regulator [Luteibacter sp. SG786]|uniref:TetR/AcrR family transcriptional regulator n=1 Tax=Luteibacter sp. SG786 TaxID=2587130 RepID=UPI00141F3EB4|nr:TetR/AcrR family transcriptional regulator [Luteibacter sp. SG786]NII55141.1 AcrR family transcriptional regulator [Luteibacter sp. SG786]